MVGRRMRWWTLGVVLVLLAALLPPGLAAGSHDGSATSGDPSVVLLTLGASDQVTWMDQTQRISGRNNCSVQFPDGQGLLAFTPTGGSLGLVKDGLGVKSTGDGNGEPCGRVEAEDGEAITVSLGSNLAGYVMTAIDVDLELKFNASVEVIFKHDGAIVHTEVFTGTGGSDDGPDSADGDNYRFAYPGDGDDPIQFDQVIFDPFAGSISLEGGADGTENGTLASNNSSQFQVVRGFDGQINCQPGTNTVTIADPDVEGVVGVVTMRALDLDASTPTGWDANCMLLKNYNDEVTPNSLLFAPELENSLARYTLELTLDGQEITTGPDGQVASLFLEYDDGAGGPVMALQPCNGEPEFTAAFFEQASTGLLPAGEFACYFGVSLTPTSPGFGTEVWDIYFEDDPNFGFK